MVPDEQPRILFLRVPERVRHEFDELPGTHTFVDDLDQVHPSDHDLLVTFGSDYSDLGCWHVLGFGIDWAGSFTRGARHNNARHAYVAREVGDRATRDLVQRSIVDVIAERPRRVWHQSGRSWDYALSFGGFAHPLVQLGTEGATYALLAVSGDKLVWALPEETTEHRAWLIHVLRTLHKVSPDQFPAEPDWQGAIGEWSTPELLATSEEHERLVEDRDRILAEAEARIADAKAALDEQRQAAVTGAWRLLTAEGDELVAAVKAALESFGFTVQERDEEHHARHGRRLEDLLVTDPEAPSWESLVEVKGYTRGARVNDVAQVLGAPSTYFAVERGRPPVAVWHVVNPERGVDPSARAVAIPNDKDLLGLTEANGALIDTRDLFRAWCAARTGNDPADIRVSLREAVTRWTWPA